MLIVAHTWSGKVRNVWFFSLLERFPQIPGMAADGMDIGFREIQILLGFKIESKSSQSSFESHWVYIECLKIEKIV